MFDICLEGSIDSITVECEYCDLASLWYNAFTSVYRRMAYDLRRIRLAGLIHGIPHTSRYPPIPEGTRTALYTKIYNRLLIPLILLKV